MKISKTIREFIEEQVRIKAAQSPRIAELEQVANEAKKNFKAEKDKLEKEWNKALKEMAKKYHIEHCRPPYVSFSYLYEHDLPEVIAYNKAKDELYEKRRLATLNIIAEMELGGTKAELMEKLSNLQF